VLFELDFEGVDGRAVRLERYTDDLSLVTA